jgi:predicted transposase/invertase (TIGR01784 family)
VSLNSYRDFKNSIDTARAEGKAEGRTERDVEIAKKLKIRGMSFDKISEITDLTFKEIEKI